MWEDPINQLGSELQITFDKNLLPLEDLSKLWEYVVFRIVTKELKRGNEVTGARVVDKCNEKNLRYRIEIWYSADVREDKELE